MKPYIHPKDEGLPLQRKIGKGKGPSWKIAATAKLAPQELDNCSEDTIRAAVEGIIQSYGAVYITFEDRELAWLKFMASKHHQAASLLKTLKDMPDFMVLRKLAKEPYARTLSLELKRKKKSDGGRPGQRQLAEVLDGKITMGFQAAQDELEKFFG